MAVAAALLLAGTLAAQAQGTRAHRVGFVTPLSGPPEPPTLRAFRQGLQELGYVDGRDVVIEARFAGGRADRLPELIAELLRLRIDVLLAGSTPGAVAAKKATTLVPIVFAGVSDPIGPGIVASLSNPGGNITGVTVGVDSRIAGKWVELLKEAVPAVSHIAALSRSAYPLSVAQVQEMQAAALSLNVKLDVLEAGNVPDLDRALAAIGTSGAQGIIMTAEPFSLAHRGRIAQFAAGSRLPAVHFSRLFAEAGGLMSYGGSLEDSYRTARARDVPVVAPGPAPPRAGASRGHAASMPRGSRLTGPSRSARWPGDAGR
jgi:putative ABC transport system substrate-binding protein